ncbi:uncharacterized protein LOC132307308 [Cornus florida]|uniref:uncharacterized protein LOC132307308 n=1 Tax=Cornus florida TaxID=4283 RepID=UPI00289BEE1A|nr:uncharacterized protein LOC132307308 [Cornus florida]
MKNKFLLCFRPVVLKTEMETRDFDCSRGQVCTYISQHKQKDLKNSTIKSPLILSKNLRPKSNSRRSLFGFFKVVLFVISLRNRVRHRNVHQLKSPSRISNPKSFDVDNKQNKTISSSQLKTSELLSNKKSLSGFRSISFDQKKQSIHKAQELSKERTGNRVTKGSSSNSGLYLLFITLSVTIFWGKVCAILFALTWFYFLPRRSYFKQPSENKATSPAVMEKLSDYRKRVIMEGMLERNHHLRRIKSFT